jgi:ferrous iron transport protein B
MTTAVIQRIALVGSPNCGKTALFNLLTGSRQKVANYAGVTVERKEGRFRVPSGRDYVILDLPGAYSLNAASLDEAVTRDLIRGFYPGEAAPDLLVCVVDATNLRLHLRFALELRQLGRPMLVALNMADAARSRGIGIDVEALQRELGVPVVETVAVRRDGARELARPRTRRARNCPQMPICIRKPGACSRSRCPCRDARPPSTMHWTAGCCIRCSACSRWAW